MKYRVKAGAETAAPEAALRVAESTRYEEESLRGSVKLSLNSRRVLARFRPPRRLHNGRIYVQRSVPDKNENVVETARSAGTFMMVRINNAVPQHGEISQLLPLCSLTTLVRAFYAAQIRIDGGGSADDINSCILQRFRGKRNERKRILSHKYTKFIVRLFGSKQIICLCLNSRENRHV